MKVLIFPELSYKVCGLLFYVHNRLGRFRKEREYATALEIVLKENNVKYSREENKENDILGKKFSLYRTDFIIDSKIIIELKSVPVISKEDYYQLKRYLESRKMRLGLLVNFGDKFLKPKRILNHL